MPHHRRDRVRDVALVVGALALVAGVAAGLGIGTAGAARASSASPSFGRLAATSNGAATYQAVATFTGPVTVGHVIEPETALPTDLTAHGYVEQEFFASGTAHAFTATSTPSDGRWTIEPTSAAGYRTRILVRRPSNPAHFSGTVVVEWLNESEGESAPDWDYLNPELMDAGDAWVGVSAQALGVEGGAPILGRAVAGVGNGLIQQEPQRYGSLHHPGDQYALDIFDQIGLGLRSGRSRVLGTAPPPAHRGRGGIAVGLLPDHLRRHAAAAQPPFRRHLHPQPGRRRRRDQRRLSHLLLPQLGPPDPDRPPRACLHVRDADRPDRTGLRRGAAAEHPVTSGPGRWPARRMPTSTWWAPPSPPCSVVIPPSTAGRSTTWCRPRSLRSPVGSYTGLLHPLPLRSGFSASTRRRSPWIRMATSSAGCARRRWMCRFRRSAGQEHQARASSAHSSARPCPFRRRCWSACTARRPTTCRGSRPSSTEPSLRDYLLASERSALLAQAGSGAIPAGVTPSRPRERGRGLCPLLRPVQLGTVDFGQLIRRRRRCDSELEQSDDMGVPKDENVT